MLSRRDVGLLPLLSGAVLERALHVVAAEVPVGAGELAIDEYGAAKILASEGELVGRNETIDNGLDGRPLLRGKKAPGT